MVLQPGTYKESPVLRVPLTLIGQSSSNTHIVGTVKVKLRRCCHRQARNDGPRYVGFRNIGVQTNSGQSVLVVDAPETNVEVDHCNLVCRRAYRQAVWVKSGMLAIRRSSVSGDGDAGSYAIRTHTNTALQASASGLSWSAGGDLVGSDSASGMFDIQGSYLVKDCQSSVSAEGLGLGLVHIRVANISGLPPLPFALRTSTFTNIQTGTMLQATGGVKVDIDQCGLDAGEGGTLAEGVPDAGGVIPSVHILGTTLLRDGTPTRTGQFLDFGLGVWNVKGDMFLTGQVVHV